MRITMRYRAGRHWAMAFVAVLLAALVDSGAHAQQASVSAWDAADFRVWGFIPYWASASTINSFATNGMYKHVSDVLYFGAVRPDVNGNLPFASASYQTNLTTLRSHAASQAFDLHLSVFEVTGGNTDAVWNAIISDPVKRANFVNSAKNLLQGGAGTADDLKGFNFDWERPAADAEWGNYTQLARELRAAINPLGMEVSVCDYGSTDSDWDDTSLFDANVYDQLFMMVYHINASSSANWANTKLALTGQGAPKAFSDDQIAVGFGTWGTGGPATVDLKAITAANPNLPYDALTFSGTINDINGVSRTGTWTIESRKQVREKTQLAFDRGMPGMFSWTLHYDATNNLGLHRVVHHYTVVKRNVPDLNLDGRADAVDANTLANNMGTVPGWTGMATAAQFDDFYLSGNWEKGDHDGNGFVNQLDADWLAGRYAALAVNLPDRLAYSGTFEAFQNSSGLTGRWRAIRDAGNIRESGNYTQHAANFLSFTGTGVGADKHSSNAVTIRNQNSAEAFDVLNTLPRVMQADLATPIDLGTNEETYFTFLARQDTGGLLTSQLNSDNRILSLEFLNAVGQNQIDFSFFGEQQEWAIRSQADAAGDDVSMGGFAEDTTYLVVGKLSGNGAEANTLQASIFAGGSTVDKFTAASFPWMLTANSSADFNPMLTQLQFTSLFEGSYTVSNLWIGPAAAFFAPTPASLGDFNADGVVDAADYAVWRSTAGQIGSGLAADGNEDGQVGDADYAIWTAHFGQTLGSAAGAGANVNSSGSPAVPEPAAFVLLVLGSIMKFAKKRR